VWVCVWFVCGVCGVWVCVGVFVCVGVAFVVQHAMHMRHIAICCLPRCTIFFLIISWTGRFSKKCYWIQNVCCYFLHNVCSKYFSFCEEFSEIWTRMYIGLHVKYRLLLADCNETGIFSTDFHKIPKYQISWKSLQQEPSCSMRTDGQTWRI
jgi:hypothetical protein